MVDGKTGTTGIRKRILEVLGEDKKQLYSVPELMDILKESKQTVENSLRTIRIDGVIDRHKDLDVNGDYQFAVSIHANNIEPYAPTRSGGNNKKKGKTLTTKEIRSMFAANFNNMAKLEDAVMASLDRLDDLDKEMNRIKTALKLT